MESTDDPHVYLELQSEFLAVKSFSDLLAANASFIRGEIHYTPYHTSPLCPETEPLIPDLLRMHNLGLLTDCGQPGLLENGEVSPPVGEGYYEQQQKPFCCFFIQKNPVALRFVEDLFSSGLAVFVTNLNTGEQRGSQTDRCTVTQYRVGATMEQLKDAPWELFTSIGPTTADEILESWSIDFYPSIREFLISCLFVQVTRSEYGAGKSLERELIDRFRKAQESDVFSLRALDEDLPNS